MEVLSNSVQTFFESLYNKKILRKYHSLSLQKTQENDKNKKKASYNILRGLYVEIVCYINFGQIYGTIAIYNDKYCIFAYYIVQKSYKNKIKNIISKIQSTLMFML